MEVNCAAHVLGASLFLAVIPLVYSKELPEAAMATAYFFDKMYILFDCLNSSQFKKTGPKWRHAMLKRESEILDYLHQQLGWISAWQFQSRRQAQAIIGWQVIIKSVLMLWDELSNSHDFKFLLTRRLQQDPLEKRFGAIYDKMLGCNTNPNVHQITLGQKHIGIKKLFKLLNNGNVEDDKADLFKELPISWHYGSSISDNVGCLSIDNFPPLENIPELESDIRSNIIDDSSTYCVWGYLIKLVLEQTAHSCGCSRLLWYESDNLTRPHQYFLVLKAYHVPGKFFGNL
uniref:Putative transposase n=1 Tax=Ixodes ricinus TaxID=34613 RepID=A0A147BD60_IXORI